MKNNDVKRGPAHQTPSTQTSDGDGDGDGLYSLGDADPTRPGPDRTGPNRTDTRRKTTLSLPPPLSIHHR